MNVPSFDLAAVAPIAFVSIGALVVLLAEVILSRRASFLGRRVTAAWIGTVLAMVSALTLAIAAYAAGASYASGEPLLFQTGSAWVSPVVQLDRFSAFATVLLALAGFLVCWLSMQYLAEVGINHGEYYALLLLSTAGMMLLVASTDLLGLFLGLELMSIPIYVLAGFDRRKVRSNESAMKYFLIGSFASALLLYGIALIYGTTGGLDFAQVQAGFSSDNRLAVVGVGLVAIGFAFKVSAVPFHQWTPDVYEGSPVAVTAFMSVTVKLAAFVALMRFLVLGLGDAADELRDLFWILAALTMVVGNVMAVIQSNLKRLLAYSAVAHAGYLLIAFAAGTLESYSAALFYLLGYVFMNLGAFAVLIALSTNGRDCESIDDLAGLAASRPGLAAVMTLFAISLAGIPGTVGFTAKFFLFRSAVDAGLIGLALVAIAGSLVSVYYYLRIPVVMYMRDAGDAKVRSEAATGEVLVLALCAFAVILWGLFPTQAPGLLDGIRALEWARESAAQLFF